jgi:RimJ/RimL family protein N-acetyltransferase
MRPMVAADADLFCRMYGDPQTMLHISDVVARLVAAVSFQRAIFGAANGHAPFLFTINTTDGNAVGLCGLVQLDGARGRAEVGMMLVPSACALGYASEVLPALTTAVFLSFPIDRVWVQYAPAHIAAKRLVRRVGFLSCAEGEITERRIGNCVWAVDRLLWMSERDLNQGEG